MTAETITGLATAGLPTLTVLVGILINRSDANRLEGRINALDARISNVEISLRNEIASTQSTLRAEIAASRKQSHDDIMMLLGHEREQDARISRLENAR